MPDSRQQEQQQQQRLHGGGGASQRERAHQQQQQQQPAAGQLNAGGRASLNGHNEPKSKQQIASSSAKPAGAKGLDFGSASSGFGRLSESEASGQVQPVDFGGSGNEREQSQQSASSRLLLLEHPQPRASQLTEQQRRQQQPAASYEDESNEKSRFIECNWQSGDANKSQENAGPSGRASGKQRQRARLAQQESITERKSAGDPSKQIGAPFDYVQRNSTKRSSNNEKKKKKKREAEEGCCFSMLRALRARRCLIVGVVILVIYIAAIYCLPTVEINPEVPSQLPVIPFDFQEGPLRPSSASAFKFKHLFKGQIHGPESLAFDSAGNLYMAIEGGFILYAHLNKSSPMKRSYFESAGRQKYLQQQQQQQQDSAELANTPQLVKIAELNGMLQVASKQAARRGSRIDPDSMWRRECQMDEKVYGDQLFVQDQTQGFKSKVLISRCSKPLGIRLNADETQLYVIDTLAGLFRVDLGKTIGAANSGPRKARASNQRQVFKLIDFRANGGYLELPAVQLEDEPEELPAPGQATGGGGGEQQAWIQPATRLMNVSMKALDDLAIDRSSDGTHDLIYMTVASQSWPATSFVFDALEGRPSGRILRYSTGNNQLVVLEPNRVALVRTSVLKQQPNSRGADLDELRRSNASLFAERSHQPSFLLGAPRMDENDLFDDRPLNFPNGLELTDDRQALLIADTSNKRILKHYIRGPRRGTSDLWAWTPMYPDNIRRGRGEGGRETYWVVGCGRAKSSSSVEEWLHYDPFELLRTWPQLRKFLLKNIYLMGYLVELIGENLLQSTRVQDLGYGLRTGSSLCQSGCPGMMIIQYNKYGDIIRSIHSREFPNDLYYYSQVNELIDPESHEHSLYLGSPSYSYLTKLTLPSESLADTTYHQANNNNYHNQHRSHPVMLADNNNNNNNFDHLSGSNQINSDYMR